VGFGSATNNCHGVADYLCFNSLLCHLSFPLFAKISSAGLCCFISTVASKLASTAYSPAFRAYGVFLARRMLATVNAYPFSKQLKAAVSLVFILGKAAVFLWTLGLLDRSNRDGLRESSPEYHIPPALFLLFAPL
jgi:hypothetical protein